jgi:hypothetical protein
LKGLGLYQRCLRFCCNPSIHRATMHRDIRCKLASSLAKLRF